MDLFSTRPEASWKKFGEIDPYYGVLSAERFSANRINDAAKEEFFASGITHVNRVFDVFRAHYNIAPCGRALDFGCGVGRISSALAPHFETVTGLDVAPGMIAEARRNAEFRGERNLTYAASDDPSFLIPETYDFIHSYLVLQHIPPKTGELIVRELLEALKTGGFGALHFTYREIDPTFASAVAKVVKNTPLVRNIANLTIGRRWGYPAMQMNAYSASRVIDILAQAGVPTFVAARVDDWTHYGLFVFFRKEGRGSDSPWSNPKRRSTR